MKSVFDIVPPGLSEADLARVGAKIEDLAKHETDFVFHAYFASLQLLLVVQHEGGRVIDWMLMPCRSQDEASELLNWWTEQVTDDMRERQTSASESAGGVVAALLKQKH